MTEDERANWHREAGLSSETTSARIYPSKKQKEIWEEESDDQSLSSFIIEMVEEARITRQHGKRASKNSGYELERLREKNEELKRRLSGENNAPDLGAEQIESLLGDTPKTLDEILQQAIQEDVVKQTLKRQIEEKLYELAEQDVVQYTRNPTGWKLR